MSTDSRPAPCYREANGVYFTRNAHRHDCAEAECRGCTPCAGRHCSARKTCTWHIDEAEVTCGRCIAGVRRDLLWIESLAALMLTAAIADGLESEAANLAGPAADPRALTEWQVARKSHLRAWESLGRITEGQHLHALLAMDTDDERHPYSVLTRWQMMLAEDYAHEMPARLSTTGAAAYLGRVLHRVANDEEQDFGLLRAELRKCRQHLEAVLHNDTKPEQGAPCPLCRSAHRADCDKPDCRGCVIVRLRRQYAHWCDDDECEKFHFVDDGSDTWHCPRDSTHWWTQQGYADLLDERRGSKVSA